MPSGAGASCAFCLGRSSRASQQPGITAAPTVARAYDLILDANFDELNEALPATCPPAPVVACLGLKALGLWWQIQLDPDSRSLDARVPGRRSTPRSPKRSA